MRVTHIRPAPTDGLHYRLALLLHSHLELDGEHKGVDLRRLPRSDARELLKGLEAKTGLVSGLMAIDSMPEPEED